MNRQTDKKNELKQAASLLLAPPKFYVMCETGCELKLEAMQQQISLDAVGTKLTKKHTINQISLTKQSNSVVLFRCFYFWIEQPKCGDTM